LTAGNDESSHLSFGLRPDPAARTKPGDQPAVLHGREPKPELAHPAVAEKPINFGEKARVHGGVLTRFSVHVNPPATTCVLSSLALLRGGMSTETWEARLRQAIQERWVDQGRSLTELSLNIHNGRNFVSQMLTEGKAPRAKDVVNLAAQLQISLSWLFLGVDMTQEDEQLLMIASKIDTHQKKKLLELLNSIAAQNA
jgi:hypothetical protein